MSTNSEAVKPEVKKGLSLVDLVAISSGQVIGAGIITLIGPAISETGFSAWLAYTTAIIIGFLSILPFIFISSTLVLKGGEYSIVLNMLGEKIAGVYSVAFITQCLSLSLLGKSMGIYINSIFPEVNAQIVGIIAVSIFYFLNLAGANIMSGVQNILTGILILSLLIFTILGLTRVGPQAFDFTSPEFFSNGLGGFMSAISLYAYSTYGQYMVINFSEKATRPKKDIPLAIIISTVIILVLYTLIAIVDCGVLPYGEVANQPLTIIARKIFNPLFFVVFIIGGPIMALATTMNSTFGSRANPLYRATLDGWFPAFLGKKNSKDIPYVIYTAIFLIGLIPLMLNLNIKTITNNLVLVGNLLRMITAIAVFRLPEIFKDQWEESWLYVNKGLFTLLMGLALSANLYLVYLSLVNLPWYISAINIAFLFICAIFALMRYGKGKVHIISSVSLK